MDRGRESRGREHQKQEGRGSEDCKREDCGAEGQKQEGRGQANCGPESRERFWARREQAADLFGCRDELSALDAVEQCSLYNRLAAERMEQKAGRLRRLYLESDRNWMQLFFLGLFHTVGDLRNRDRYLELARRIGYAAVLHERYTQPQVEALLLGTAGLLDGCRRDDYTALLEREFDHQRHKYRIEPMRAEEWDLHVREANHPRLRLVQIAAFLTRSDFLVDEVLKCRTREEVQRLFSAEAPQYWSSYYNPSNAADHTAKRLGAEKASLIGINLAAVFQYLYGRETGREEYLGSAFALWEALPAERNRFTTIWHPVAPHNAFESQALLQLAREYCTPRRCRLCPLAARIWERTCSEAR